MKKALLTATALAVFAAGVIIVLVSVAGDEREPVIFVPGADPEAGRELVAQYGCGSCHRIPGVESIDGYVGPPLDDLAERRYIAGDEPNTLDVLISWIQDPQALEPGTVMPKLGVTPEEARDIAAYLYSDQ